MDTRLEIVQVAITLLQERGSRGWSYQDISQQIGIKKASIHYYFPSKKNLIEEALKQYIYSIHSRLEGIKSREPKSEGRILDFLSLYQEAYDQQHRLCLCVMMTSEVELVSDRVKVLLLEFYDNMLHLLEDFIEEGIAKGEFKKQIQSVECANFILNSLQGLLLRGHLEHKKEAFQAISTQILTLLRE